MRLRLEKFVPLQGVNKGAHELLQSLVQQIRSLSELVDAKAPVSDICDVLIKVNTAAKSLASALALSSLARS
jgi:hypothetical protein